MVRVPAVVVGDHCDGCVCHFGFSSEFSFGHVCHADYVAVPASVEFGFGSAGELRAFHREVCASDSVVDTQLTGCFDNSRLSCGADGICHADVRYESGAEERFFACECAVDELVDEYEVAGFVFFFERADGRERHNTIDACFFEDFDVGSVVDFGGWDAVAASVSGEKDESVSFEVAYQ